VNEIFLKILFERIMVGFRWVEGFIGGKLGIFSHDLDRFWHIEIDGKFSSKPTHQRSTPASQESPHKTYIRRIFSIFDA
jgi:hypothetical protein